MNVSSVSPWLVRLCRQKVHFQLQALGGRFEELEDGPRQSCLQHPQECQLGLEHNIKAKFGFSFPNDFITTFIKWVYLKDVNG